MGQGRIVHGQDFGRTIAGRFLGCAFHPGAQDCNQHVSAELAGRLFAGLNGDQRTLWQVSVFCFGIDQYIPHDRLLKR